jgi:hypothetical protein
VIEAFVFTSDTSVAFCTVTNPAEVTSAGVVPPIAVLPVIVSVGAEIVAADTAPEHVSAVQENACPEIDPVDEIDVAVIDAPNVAEPVHTIEVQLNAPTSNDPVTYRSFPTVKFPLIVPFVVILKELPASIPDAVILVADNPVIVTVPVADSVVQSILPISAFVANMF